MHPIKKIVLEFVYVLYLMPLWGLLIFLDQAARLAKFSYKMLHWASEKVALHIESTIPDWINK